MDEAGIYARRFESLGCAVELGVAAGRVVGVSFPDAVADDARPDHPLLDRIEAYLDGAEDHFDDVDVALTVPTDQRRVLDAVRKVPYGRQVSRERLANLSGLDPEEDADRELVSRALGGNPIPLFVPDHRVDGGGATPDDVARQLRRVEA